MVNSTGVFYVSSKELVLVVPIPPSVNHCYYHHNNKPIKTSVARSYCENVTNKTRLVMARNTFPMFPPKQKIRCEMHFYFPDNRNRDTHNTFKLLFDAIEDGGLYQNDRYVLPNVLDFETDKANPRLELKFYLKEDINNAS